MIPNSRPNLRTGYTTGTCAAAAAKGGALMLSGAAPQSVSIRLPAGEQAVLQVHDGKRMGNAAVCEIIKDAGDDPDITNGARIRALVTLVSSAGVVISGGEGVGIVTRPGLAVPPGKPAINPVPEQMIRASVQEVLPLSAGVEVMISVADGLRLAQKTLNGRLGIIGGLSILGTTGLVIPYSQNAYQESIRCALDVVQALGIGCAVLCTGRASEKEARLLLPDMPEAAFVLMADYVACGVYEAVTRGIKKIIIAGFPGKLLKIAAGASCTHYHTAQIDLAFFARIAGEAGCASVVVETLNRANTVRHAFALLPQDCQQRVLPVLTQKVIEQAQVLCRTATKIEVILLSYSGGLLYHDKRH